MEKQDGRDFSSCDILTQFSIFYLFFSSVSLSNCNFCVNISTNHITVEELRATFDENLAPLKEIAELRSFIENANQKYDQVLKKLTEKEKERKEIKKENKFLKSTGKRSGTQLMIRLKLFLFLRLNQN